MSTTSNLCSKTLQDLISGCSSSGRIAQKVVQSIQNELEDVNDVKKLQSFRGNRSVFFVGAGASVESSLPNFKQFSEHLLTQTLPDDTDVEGIEMFASELRPEVLLQTLHSSFGNNIFDFYSWFDDAKPSTNHYILARVLYEGGLVLTTNVDTLIEEAYDELYGTKNKKYHYLVSKDDFDTFPLEELSSSRVGILMKFHGTVDIRKPRDDPSRYDSIRFLLDQVGEGVSLGMHKILSRVCKNHDMIFLGYSGCDNFSIQPVISNIDTNAVSLWLWYEWRDDMVLEDSSQTFKDEMTKIGQHIAEGTPFSKIPRGLESLSTCEILANRSNCFRVRGNAATIMHSTRLHIATKLTETKEPPIPDWVHNISLIESKICLAKFYFKTNITDLGLNHLDSALEMAQEENDASTKALILKTYGNEILKASVSSSYDKALDMLNKALITFHDEGDVQNEIDLRLDVINIHRRMRNFQEAEDHIKSVESIISNHIETKNDGQIEESFFSKSKIRTELMKGLILGMGHADKASKEAAIPILDEAARLANESGFVSLHATVLNANGLVKYQAAGNSIELLESGANDLLTAYQLNVYIGDARSCFQQKRNLGLIHSKLSKLQGKPELLDEAIEDFRSGEKFLFRLSRKRIIGELLEIRFRLGEALVAVSRLEEAEPVLLGVREERIKLGDWHNEARTLELLLKTATSSNDLIERAKGVKGIYEDAKTNDEKQKRFKKQPITVSNGKSILLTAATVVESDDMELATELKDLMESVFGNMS